MEKNVFEPRDPNYKKKIQASFANQGAMKTLGGELIAVEPGRVVIELPFSNKITQQHGFVHAGVLTTMMDSAAGYAAFSLMPEEAEVLTIEFKTSLMAPAKGGRFRFQGHVVKSGRTITFTEAEAFALVDGENNRKLATLTATMMTVTGRDDVKG